MRNCSWAVVAVAALALAGGCGQEEPPTIVEAEGTVLLDGQPLKKAQVRFSPVGQKSEYLATGVTDEKGRFTLTCKGQPGACAGANYVTVTEAEIPERLLPETARAELAKYLASLGNRPIPAKYANMAENPLRVTVTAGRKVYNFKLER